MANIRKRVGKRGTTWQVQVRVQGHPTKTKSFDDYDEAVDWGKNEQAKLTLDKRGTSDRRPLREALERYMETVLPRKAASTQKSQGDRLRWWYDHYGGIRLDQLTPDRVARVRDEIERRASGPTANRYLAVLSHVMTVASREWGWVRDNPVRRVNRCPENPPRVRFLETEETERLLAVCRKIDPTFHTFVVIALTTAMRRGEISALRWKQVDLRRRVIVLDKTKNKDRRGIPISDALLEELRQLPRRLDTDLLFPAPMDAQKPRTFRKEWDQALEDSKIEDFRFHDLRHTVASYLAMSGATERELAEILGHKTMAMVKRYSHLSTTHVAGLLDRVSTVLVPKVTTQ